jgi:hypothetical protein
MKKLILTIITIATLFSCSTEEVVEVIIEPTEPTETTEPEPTVVGTWEHILDETYYNSGVITDIIICGNTIEIWSNLWIKTANCSGGGEWYDSLTKQGDLYLYDSNPDIYVKLNGSNLERVYAGDYPITVSTYRKI